MEARRKKSSRRGTSSRLSSAPPEAESSSTGKPPASSPVLPAAVPAAALKVAAPVNTRLKRETLAVPAPAMKRTRSHGSLAISTKLANSDTSVATKSPLRSVTNSHDSSILKHSILADHLPTDGLPSNKRTRSSTTSPPEPAPHKRPLSSPLATDENDRSPASLGGMTRTVSIDLSSRPSLLGTEMRRARSTGQADAERPGLERTASAEGRGRREVAMPLHLRDYEMRSGAMV